MDIRLICISAMLLGVASCSSLDTEVPAREYVIGVDGHELSLSTRAVAVSSVPENLWWCATSGTSGISDVQKCAPAQGTVEAGRLRTGEYQGTTPLPLNWYLANGALTMTSAGPCIMVDGNGTDIVAGCVKATPETSPAVTLKHIFARTGALTFNAQDGYAVSGVSWKISRAVSGTAGSYNIAADSWTPGTAAMGETVLASGSDLYLIPGTYTFTITYTLSREHYKETFTRSGTATLEQGRVNSITATATGGGALSITVSSSLYAWASGPDMELIF